MAIAENISQLKKLKIYQRNFFKLKREIKNQTYIEILAFKEPPFSVKNWTMNNVFPRDILCRQNFFFVCEYLMFSLTNNLLTAGIAGISLIFN